ncbi:MAG: hypothetical protein R3F46_14225 [bacterium]
MSMLKKALRALQSGSRRGFSLIDVMIGLVLLALALMFGLQVSIASSRVTQSNMFVSSAANLAEVKIEELRNIDFDLVVDGADGAQINELGEVGGIYSRSWTVTEDMPEDGMKQVTVFVSWQRMGQTSTFDLTGVIAP